MNPYQDYVEEKYEEAHPFSIKVQKCVQWVSPPSTVMYKRLKNLYDKGVLGGVEAFLPTPRQLATNYGEGFCAWSGPQAIKGLRSRAHEILQLLACAQNISLLTITINLLEYGLYPSEEEPIERPIQIRDDLGVATCLATLVIGKGKVVVVEDGRDSSDEDAPSLLIWDGSPFEV
uniref:Uncharacterized protein n=1 Tax=Cannabis sativa TaxID=3483 RepID=A0A803P482_CANSA